MAAPALIIISSAMLDRRKEVLKLPQQFPFDIDDLVDIMAAEIIWDKHETILFIDDFSRIPLQLNTWLRDDRNRHHAYWDISEGHLSRANSIADVVRRLEYPYGHPTRHDYTPFLRPEVFAIFLLGHQYQQHMSFKQFLKEYTPPEIPRFKMI